MAMRLTVLLFTLLLAACTSDVQLAKQLLEDSLVLKEGLQFHEVRAYPGGVVCGEFSAIVSLTEPPVQNQPFTVIEGQLNRSPERMDIKVLCNDDPAAAFMASTGIGPVSKDNPELVKIIRDYAAFADALEAYYKDNFYYPSADQGLAALVTPPEGGRPLVNYREGGYLAAVPLDPWERAYVYTDEQWGRTKGRYEITTLGRSGDPGGEGADADVSSNYLPYLLHLARVAGID